MAVLSWWIWPLGPDPAGTDLPDPQGSGPAPVGPDPVGTDLPDPRGSGPAPVGPDPVGTDLPVRTGSTDTPNKMRSWWFWGGLKNTPLEKKKNDLKGKYFIKKNVSTASLVTCVISTPKN